VLAEAFGGAQIYDPAKRTFTTTPSAPVRRAQEVIAQVPGAVILTGGNSTTTSAALDLVETFNDFSHVFGTTGHLITRRTGHTATAINDRQILIAGGFHDPDNASMASVEMYELEPTRQRAARH
jgi:hypothetical protein